MYYTDSFTMALALTFLVILGMKWLTINRHEKLEYKKRNPPNLAAELRIKYLASLEHLLDNPYDEDLLDHCYHLGHQLYDRTIITDDSITITSQSREKIDNEIQGVYNSPTKKAA